MWVFPYRFDGMQNMCMERIVFKPVFEDIAGHEKGIAEGVG